METKVCSKCNCEKPTEEFYTTKGGSTLKDCRECRNEYQRGYQKFYRQNNKDKVDRWNANRRAGRTPRRKKPHICMIRYCDSPSEEYKGIVGYCKSHAFDKFNEDV